MAAPRAPTTAEIEQYIFSRTGGEMLQLVRGLREPQAQVALTETLLLAPPRVAGPSKTPEKAEKAKKALNAFVGFRCYYISIPHLKQWPMKKLSNIMGGLWDSDLNKPHWSLMAKAWSAIRDQVGKDNAPLDQFFRIICPYLRMPSPDVYLELHGWIVVVNNDGDPTISRHPDFTPSSVSVEATDIAFSVEDIISYCQSMGYAQAYVPGINTTSSTFIGCSSKQAVEQNATVEVPTVAVGRAVDERLAAERLAARNGRRDRRKNARDTGLARELQEEIANAHATQAADQNDDASPFYDHLTALLKNHTANTNQNATLANHVVQNMALPNFTHQSASLHNHVAQNAALANYTHQNGTLANHGVQNAALPNYTHQNATFHNPTNQNMVFTNYTNQKVTPVSYTSQLSNYTHQNVTLSNHANQNAVLPNYTNQNATPTSYMSQISSYTNQNMTLSTDMETSVPQSESDSTDWDARALSDGADECALSDGADECALSDGADECALSDDTDENTTLPHNYMEASDLLSDPDLSEWLHFFDSADENTTP